MLEAHVATTGAGTSADFSLEFDGNQVTDLVVHEATSIAFNWASVRRGGIRLKKGLHRMRMQSAGFRINWLRFTLDSLTSREQLPGLEQIALYENHPNPFTTMTQLP